MRFACTVDAMWASAFGTRCCFRSYNPVSILLRLAAPNGWGSNGGGWGRSRVRKVVRILQIIMTQMKNFIFIEIYFQLPWLKPFINTHNIVIETCVMFNTIRTAVHFWVICIELNMRIRNYFRYNVDEQNKKKWTFYRALRRATTNSNRIACVDLTSSILPLKEPPTRKLANHLCKLPPFRIQDNLYSSFSWLIQSMAFAKSMYTMIMFATTWLERVSCTCLHH